MKPEIKLVRVLEMLLADGFTKLYPVGPQIDEYGKGTLRLHYDSQRDMIINSYEIREVEKDG